MRDGCVTDRGIHPERDELLPHPCLIELGEPTVGNRVAPIPLTSAVEPLHRAVSSSIGPGLMMINSSVLQRELLVEAMDDD